MSANAVAELIPLAEAAIQLGESHVRTFNRLSTGQIRGERGGRRGGWLVRRADVEAILAERSSRAEASAR